MERFIGLDAHSKTCTLVVMSATGRKLREMVVETNGSALVDAVRGIAGTRRLCMEEGAQSQWLFEILDPHVDELTVVKAIKHAGNKSDSIDAWDLAERLRTGVTRTQRIFKVNKLQGLRAASRAQRTAMRDMVRAKNRLRAVYRARGIPVEREIYTPKNRASAERKLPSAERKLAQQLGEHLDAMLASYERANEWLKAESAKVPAVARLRTVPGLGAISAAHVVAIVITPDRFRTKRQFWSFSGLGVVTRTSADWMPDKNTGRWVRREINQTRGLNRNRRPELKSIFKAAALSVIRMKDHPLTKDYEQATRNGIKPNLARLTLARRIAAATLAIWKRKEEYDSEKHCAKAA